MPSQSVIVIFPVAMIILWAGLFLLRQINQKLSRRQLLLILLGGIFAAALSLLIKSNADDFSGMNRLASYGWPHFYLEHFTPLDNTLQPFWSFRAGPLGSYFIINVIWYFAVLMLIVGGVKFLRQPRITSKKEPNQK